MMLDWEQGVETPTQQPGSDHHSITGFQTQPEVTPLHTPLHLATCALTHTRSRSLTTWKVWPVERSRAIQIFVSLLQVLKYLQKRERRDSK